MPLLKLGYGYDSHRFLTDQERQELSKRGAFTNETEAFCPDKKLVIGGVTLDQSYQERFGPFKSRSDGDVLYHAVVNALLSALGEKAARDIGTLFPNSDEANSLRPSADFMQAAVDRLKASPFELVELKLMLKGKPRVSLEQVEANLLAFFEYQEALPDVHLQGTSGEEMDGAGKGLGVEVYAVCLLQHKALTQWVKEHVAVDHA